VGIRAALQNGIGAVVQSESFGGKLRLFIDTADAESWQRWLPSGAFYGKPVGAYGAGFTCLFGFSCKLTSPVCTWTMLCLQAMVLY
jgi:hypothetical protein